MGRNDCERCGKDAGPDGLYHNERAGIAVCAACDITLTDEEERELNGPDSPNQPNYAEAAAAIRRGDDLDVVTVSFTPAELDRVKWALGAARLKFENLGKNGRPISDEYAKLVVKVGAAS